MTTGKMIGRLRALKKSFLKDGKVDWEETEQLLDAIRPIAARRKFLFEDYQRLLEKCREDGKITPDESRQLALQLDFLCSLISNLRLKFWLVIALLVLLAVSAIGVFHGIASLADTNAFTTQPDESEPIDIQ